MMPIIIFAAQYLYLLPIFIGVIVFTFQKNKKDFLMLAIPTLILSFLIGKFLNGIIQSPRPIFTDYVQPLIPTATDNGFPSDHTLVSMTVALIIFARSKTIGSILILLAICVGVARVMTHSHHVIDIIGSIAISLFSVLLVVFASRWYTKII